ncbi:MAG: hypothetical protein HC908_02885 [Calothrix sp. SM1_7_51]|nr:hypothetical protein [Calothrix sp. SM1_7_51]
MRKYTHYSEQVQKISPICMVRYLEQQGWNKKNEVEDVSVWTCKKQGRTFGVILPLSDSFVDYKRRILEILDTLEEVERRPKIKNYRVARSKSSVGLNENWVLTQGEFTSF